MLNRSAWLVGSLSLLGLLWFGAAGCNKPRCEPPSPTNYTAAPTVAAATAPRPGDPLPRLGDEIVVCGQLFHVGTPVVLWMDPGGYDAYRTEQRFGPLEQAEFEIARVRQTMLKTPNRYGLRKDFLSPEERERVRGGGWDLPLLQRVVDQFVIHYDQSGTSRRCFEVMHDQRCLSVHFMLDLDGTIYQTLDLKERAWHATTSNSRGIGVEIANLGAYGPDEKNPFEKWYAPQPDGRTLLNVPKEYGVSGIRTPNFQARPIRDGQVKGSVQDRELAQYDFTPEQYAALARLTAALCRIFPKIAAITRETPPVF